MDHLTKIMSAIKEKEVVLFNSPLYRNPYDDGEDCLPPLGLGYILTHLISMAAKLGWSAICYSNDQPVEELREKKKKMGIQSGNA